MSRYPCRICVRFRNGSLEAIAPAGKRAAGSCVKMRRVRLAAGLAAQNQGRDSSRGADKASANMSSILLCLSIPRTPIRDPPTEKGSEWFRSLK
jgi:hypothetical protein